MAKAIRAEIGAEAVLEVNLKMTADFLVAEEVARLCATVSKGQKEKNFSIGDSQSGRAEVRRNLGGSWQAVGVDGEVEGKKWIFNKARGEKLELDGVAHEMARQLAFLTADVEDVAGRIERKFGIDFDTDELSELISANIEYSGMALDYDPD